jgi:hypothetical protein
MTTLEIIETRKPTYETTLDNGQRLALWPEYGQISYEEILGDLIGVQTLDIDRGLAPIQTKDEHRAQIAQIIERHGRHGQETETAISKPRFASCGKSCLWPES